MPSNQQLLRRIKSAINIAKITKAMEAVAASKMKKSQQISQAGEEYKNLLALMTQNIKRYENPETHPLLAGKSETSAARTLIIAISADRGLCGALNSNLYRLLEEKIEKDDAVIVMGKKIVEYSKKTGWNVVGSFPFLGDYPDYSSVTGAGRIALEEFLKKNVDRVNIAYMKFVNTLVQKPVIEQLLPISFEGEEIPEEEEPVKYIFEPEKEILLQELLPYSIHLSVYQAVLSAKAAEQSARMVAMKNASENSEEVRTDLQLVYNKERQKTITAEISDVVTAQLAMN